jgi:hypothetical protein
MKKSLSFFLSVTYGVMVAYAQSVTLNGSSDGTPFSITLGNGGANTTSITSLVVSAGTIVGMLIPVMISLAVLAFFWFLIQFIWKGKDDPKVHADGMKGMGYSLIALFVMVSIWGIIAFMGTTVGIGQGGRINDIVLPKAR